ncbi:MAG: pseudouridine synthase [Pseudomonadota bacterium]|nr:pseudouridine synthase [Pseudomonadota bacterium]
MRINKYLSEMGVCSKRQADRWIQAGQVTVNGKVAYLGQLVNSLDQIVVNGHVVGDKPESRYLLYHKPVGVVCTNDQAVTGNLVDALGLSQRVFAVGRLDKASEGLLILTNDGEIFNKILRAENAHEKEYIVTVDQPITDTFLSNMASGVEILETITQACSVQKLSAKVFKIILTQGLNLQIRRMCKVLGYRVLRLQRIRIMNLQLGELEAGQYRDLSIEEKGLLDQLLLESSSHSNQD